MKLAQIMKPNAQPTILVAEYNPVLQGKLTSDLKAEGYNVIAVSNVKDAETFLKEGVDALIVGSKLPANDDEVQDLRRGDITYNHNGALLVRKIRAGEEGVDTDMPIVLNVTTMGRSDTTSLQTIKQIAGVEND